jgi:hypothetical protein
MTMLILPPRPAPMDLVDTAELLLLVVVALVCMADVWDDAHRTGHPGRDP